jgi:hypothetical protein
LEGYSQQTLIHISWNGNWPTISGRAGYHLKAVPMKKKRIKQTYKFLKFMARVKIYDRMESINFLSFLAKQLIQHLRYFRSSFLVFFFHRGANAATAVAAVATVAIVAAIIAVATVAAVVASPLSLGFERLQTPWLQKMPMTNLYLYFQTWPSCPQAQTRVAQV